MTMGHRHCIYPESSLGVIWLAGRVDSTDFIQGMHFLYGDALWQSGYATLWDLRGISEISFMPEDVDAVVQRKESLSRRRGKRAVAFVVRRGIEGDLVRLILLRQPVKRRPADVFWSVGDALQWLRIENPPPELLSDEPLAI